MKPSNDTPDIADQELIIISPSFTFAIREICLKSVRALVIVDEVTGLNIVGGIKLSHVVSNLQRGML